MEKSFKSHSIMADSIFLKYFYFKNNFFILNIKKLKLLKNINLIFFQTKYAFKT